MAQVEYEQVLVRRRRTKERVQVNEDLRGEFSSAGGMVDRHPGLVAHNEWIGGEGFGAVGTPFREARNPCPQALFVVHDEHDFFLFLTSLSPTRAAGALRESISALPDALACSDSLFSCNRRVQICVPQVLSKYGHAFLVAGRAHTNLGWEMSRAWEEQAMYGSVVVIVPRNLAFYCTRRNACLMCTASRTG